MLKFLRHIPCRFCEMKKCAAFLLAFAVLLPMSMNAFAQLRTTEIFEDDLNGFALFYNIDPTRVTRSEVSLATFYMMGAPAGLSIISQSKVFCPNPLICFRFGMSYTGSVATDTPVRFFAEQTGPNRLWSAGTYTSALELGTLTIKPSIKRIKTTRPSENRRVTEAGSTSTFYVSLGSEPSGDVTVAVSSSDTGEGTVMPNTLTFTASNYATR